MKSMLIVAMALAVAPLASAEMYKYVDKNGKTVYTDQPPADADAKRMSGPTAPATAPAAAPAKSYVERDKEIEKGREKSREQAKKTAETDKADQARKQRCEQARGNLQIYTDGGRIMKTNDKGERDYMSDEEIAAERAKTQKLVDEACAK
jgi:hypothetical protein